MLMDGILEQGNIKRFKLAGLFFLPNHFTRFSILLKLNKTIFQS